MTAGYPPDRASDGEMGLDVRTPLELDHHRDYSGAGHRGAVGKRRRERRLSARLAPDALFG